MNIRPRLVLLFLACCLLGLGVPSPSHAVSEDESLQDARLLFQSALDLKKKGKLEEAAKTYEQAIRKNRAILGEDDQGLVLELKKFYEAGLAKDPNDLKCLEGMGFLHAVCFSDFASALKYYEKVIELAPDEKIKERTRFLVDRLRVMGESAAKVQEDMATSMRDERLKEWAEMEKQEALAQQTAKQQLEAATMANLTRTKEELETRIPQLEDELKALEEELKKANRLWYTLKDDRYDRKRDRLEKDIESKKREIDDAKEKLADATKQLDAYDAAQDAKNSGKGTGKASGTPDDDQGAPPPDGQTGDGSPPAPPDAPPGGPDVPPGSPDAPPGSPDVPPGGLTIPADPGAGRPPDANPPTAGPDDPGAPPPDQPGDPDPDPVLPPLGGGSGGASDNQE
ncbi:MAG: hypothetical protein OZSIB_1563 [Candidatus Ozemobacter sibiricus]|uniref:Tetratricopeptide repeat protein n=1 Tax=Candidatus Ozemobacter sibiricus TaxID=2268124 RepID=A0A367ZLS3_9BACT|nr:MAG: hypothetical protein OZSIB_1563 [Candidatus Ozemobacter sibiricus]